MIYTWYGRNGEKVFPTSFTCVAFLREYLIYRRNYRKNMMSGISNIIVNLTGQNALKKDKGCVRGK